MGCSDVLQSVNGFIVCFHYLWCGPTETVGNSGPGAAAEKHREDINNFTKLFYYLKPLNTTKQMCGKHHIWDAIWYPSAHRVPHHHLHHHHPTHKSERKPPNIHIQQQNQVKHKPQKPPRPNSSAPLPYTTSGPDLCLLSRRAVLWLSTPLHPSEGKGGGSHGRCIHS